MYFTSASDNDTIKHFVYALDKKYKEKFCLGILLLMHYKNGTMSNIA